MKWEWTTRLGTRIGWTLMGCLSAGFAVLPFLATGLTARALEYGSAFAAPMLLSAATCFGAFRRLRGIDGRLLVLTMFAAAIVSLVPTFNGAASLATLLAPFLLLIAFAISKRRPSARLAEIVDLATLELRPGSWARPPAAETVRYGIRLRVEESDDGLVATCESPDLPRELTMSMAWSPFARTRTGDPAFDGHLHVSGPPGAVLERLDAGARSEVREAIEEGAELRGGVLRWRSVDPRRHPPIPEMIAAAHAMTCVRTLAEAAAEEREPAVRIVALEALASRPPEERLAPLSRALADESHAVRHRAAELIAADPGSPDRARGEAFLRESALAQGGLSVASDEGAAGGLSIAQQAGAVSIAKKA